MNWSKENVLALINASEALKEHPEERNFWLEKIDGFDAEGLESLAAILVKEADSRKQINDDLLKKTIRNNEAYLAELKAFKPKILKEWEASSRSDENPEAILDQMNNV